MTMGIRPQADIRSDTAPSRTSLRRTAVLFFLCLVLLMVTSCFNDREDGEKNLLGTFFPAPPVADLSLSMTVDNLTPYVGDQITFTLTLTNDGPHDATGVMVEHTLPPAFLLTSSTASTGSYDDGTGTWTIGTLANANSATLQLAGIVTDSVMFTKMAEVTASDVHDPDSVPDDQTGDDYATLAVTAYPPPLLGVLVINEIGLGVGTAPDPGGPGGEVENVNFIEIQNISNNAVSASQLGTLMLEIIGPSGSMFTIDFATSMLGSGSIPAKGFLVIYENGTWTVVSSGTVRKYGTWTPIGDWDFGSDTTDPLGVNLVEFVPPDDFRSIDLFVANGVDQSLFTGGPYFENQGTGSDSARALLGDFVNYESFDGSLGEGHTIFARVFHDDVASIDTDTASDWTTTNEPTEGALNDAASDNPQDSGNDDLNPYQGVGVNLSDGGQTVWYASEADADYIPDDTTLDGRGPDFLYGDDQDNIISGGPHNDLLFGDAGEDQLSGDTGADLLFGVEGNDTLVGGSGDDEIYGGAGNDVIEGGPGSDRFVFTAADIGPTPETDTIIDFNTSMGDILDLSQLLIGLSATPDGAELANYLLITSDGTDTTIQIDVDGVGSGPDHTIVLEDVDLAAEAGSSSSVDIIQYLLDNGNLEVEGP